MSWIVISIDSCIEFLRESQVLLTTPPISLGCNASMTEAKDSGKGWITPRVIRRNISSGRDTEGTNQLLLLIYYQTSLRYTAKIAKISQIYNFYFHFIQWYIFGIILISVIFWLAGLEMALWVLAFKWLVGGFVLLMYTFTDTPNYGQCQISAPPLTNETTLRYGNGKPHWVPRSKHRGSWPYGGGVPRKVEKIPRWSRTQSCPCPHYQVFPLQRPCMDL